MLEILDPPLLPGPEHWPGPSLSLSTISSFSLATHVAAIMATEERPIPPLSESRSCTAHLWISSLRLISSWGTMVYRATHLDFKLFSCSKHSL